MKARGNMDWLLLSLTHNGASCVDFFHVIHLDLFYLLAFSLMPFMDTKINLRFEWKWPIDFFYLQSNLDYPDIDYPDFFSGPVFSWI